MVQLTNLAVALVATASSVSVQAAPIEKRASGCSQYLIINTRGTGEMQGPSSGFRTMNSNIQSKKSGGSVYNTVYPADFSQVSTVGTNDIVNKVKTTLSSSPDACFVLEGYSQGAAATTNAMSKLTGDAFDAVKAVFLIGNPEHHSGKKCNVDTNGGQTTANVNGLSAALGGIPDNWVSKTMDVCNYGDGVCDTTHGFGINAQHLAYPQSASTQSMGAEFVLKMLNGDSSAASSTDSSASSTNSSADASASGTSSTDTSASTDSTDPSSSSSGLGSLGGLGGGSSGLSGLSGLGGGSSGLSSLGGGSGLGSLGGGSGLSSLGGGSGLSSLGGGSSGLGSLGGGSSGSSSPFGSFTGFMKRWL